MTGLLLFGLVRRDFPKMLFESPKLSNLFGNRGASLIATAPLSLAPTTGRRESKWSEPEITKVFSELLIKSIGVSVGPLQCDNLASGPMAHVVSLWRQWPRRTLYDRELALPLKDDLIQEGNQKRFSDWCFSGPLLSLKASIESNDSASYSHWVGINESNAQTLSSGIPNGLGSLNQGFLSAYQLLPDHRGLLLDFNESFMRYGRIYGSSYEGTNSSHKSPDFQRYFPPWRFAVAALACIFGIAWGWWQLRRNGRESVWIVLIFVGGLCTWGYAVYGLLRSGLDF